ncbi:MAG TPA: ABC transporter ATP-binding protein [Jiangellaceae bacterium]|nr:ABC transporter ATP-binding protein [Jiangellaceae bacterium]
MRGLDLVIEPGERVLLLGASGAGKSTLLTGLAGLLDPVHAGDAAGALTVDGLDPRAARDRVGLVLQDPETQLVMARAGDDVAFGLENQAVPADQIWGRVTEALGAVGFPYGSDRRTDQLSGGEQQRLALAGVLAFRPRLLLLDEPTANLDPAGAALVRAAVADVQRYTGATTILVEHRVADVLPLVDRVVVLEPGGGLLADGPPREVFANHGAALADAGVWVPDRPVGERRATPAGTPVELLAADEVGLLHRGAATPALDGVSATVRAGEALAVVGLNGSGKSSLATLLAGLAAPSSGTVRASPRIAGADADRAPHRGPARALAGRIGTVFQDPEHQFLTGRVRDELAFGPGRRGEQPADIGRKVDDLLDRLRLTHLAEANPFTLSGGEKRRLSVATALITSPQVLVLDEPTFGQDRRTWRELVDLLAAHRTAGGALCLVTHDEAVVSALADRVLALDRGRPAGSPTPAV